MPLIKGKSKESFEKNVKTEMHHDKPLKQSLAIAYAMKRKAQHKAMGGYADGGDASEETLGTKIGYPGFPKPKPSPRPMAEGGEMKSKRQRALEAFHKMAEGGSVESYTKREDNEKGINKPSVHSGRSEAGVALHPFYSVSEDIDKEVSKRKHQKVLNEMKSMPKPKLMAEGGFIGSHQSKDCDPDIDGGLPAKALVSLEIENESVSHPDSHNSKVDHDVMNQMGNEDEGAGDMNEIHPMVRKIIMGRAMGYSEGGRVSNDDSGESSDDPDHMAKWEDNEFDDLAKRDDLEYEYTGANSGDEVGNAQEDHDRHDIVMRIMKSRSKKDRMPRPA